MRKKKNLILKSQTKAKKRKSSYATSGVNMVEGDLLVEWLKKNLARPPGGLEGVGSFSGFFPGVFPKMKEPVLSASTDGVGTKLKLAVYFKRYKEVAQDLVAMCVNDLICSGSRPLFFMDYYACGKLRQKPTRDFLKGVQRACQQSGCFLLGGETAEMPACYKGFDFDCAGFALGVVDRKKILGSHRVRSGDRLIGVSSSGFHSNGFSLLRKVFQKDLKKWEKELIKPTALYVGLGLDLFKLKGLRAIAHITGGGMDNITRVLPQKTRAEIQAWKIPAPFQEVQKRTGMDLRELMQTLNCGVGLVLVVSPGSFKSCQSFVRKHGFSAKDLGFIRAQKKSKASWVFA